MEYTWKFAGCPTFTRLPYLLVADLKLPETIQIDTATTAFGLVTRVGSMTGYRLQSSHRNQSSAEVAYGRNWSDCSLTSGQYCNYSWSDAMRLGSDLSEILQGAQNVAAYGTI